MWLTYHVLGIQINHSRNKLPRCRVPAGPPSQVSRHGATWLEHLWWGWQNHTQKQGCLWRQRDVTGPAFLLSVHSLATLLWVAKNSSTVEVSRGMACDRAMLLLVWHDGATLDWHSCATKPWKRENTLRALVLLVVCKEHQQGKS